MTGPCSCGEFTLDGGVVPTGDYLHGPASCVRTTPLFPLPDSFVMLGADQILGVTSPTEAPRVFQRNEYRFAISREMALDHGLVLPTPAEAEARAIAHAAYVATRDAERAGPGPALTVDSLLTELGWSEEFAVHYVHPACSCSPYGEDPTLCSWARELGFTNVGGTP